MSGGNGIAGTMELLLLAGAGAEAEGMEVVDVIELLRLMPGMVTVRELFRL